MNSGRSSQPYRRAKSKDPPSLSLPPLPPPVLETPYALRRYGEYVGQLDDASGRGLPLADSAAREGARSKARESLLRLDGLWEALLSGLGFVIPLLKEVGPSLFLFFSQTVCTVSWVSITETVLFFVCMSEAHFSAQSRRRHGSDFFIFYFLGY